MHFSHKFSPQLHLKFQLVLVIAITFHNYNYNFIEQLVLRMRLALKKAHVYMTEKDQKMWKKSFSEKLPSCRENGLVGLQCNESQGHCHAEQKTAGNVHVVPADVEVLLGLDKQRRVFFVSITRKKLKTRNWNLTAKKVFPWGGHN